MDNGRKIKKTLVCFITKIYYYLNNSQLLTFPFSFFTLVSISLWFVQYIN